MDEVTLKNNERKKSARVLDWVVPCKDTEDVSLPKTPTKMSFFVINTVGGYVLAEYIGAVLKQLKPAEKDCKMLKPGENVSCTIDHGKYCEYATGDDNSHEIKYSVTSMELSNPNAPPDSSTLEGLESNTITIKVDVRNVPTRALRK